jgi:anti-sigma-K factor RskA
MESGSAATSALPPVTRVAPTPQRRATPRLSTTRLLIGLAALIVVAVAGVALYQGIIQGREREQILAILNNPAAVRVAFNAQPGGSGNVSFVMVPNSTQAVLEANQLPTLPPDKQYQLWLIDAQQPHGNAAFSVDQQPRQLLITMPATADSFQKLGITVEPRGGSQKPTTTPIFLVDVPQ